MKDLRIINIYESAQLIVQVNEFCGKKIEDKCADCYHHYFGKKILSTEKYLSTINTLSPDDLIVLRGGEPTMVKDWFEKFVQPAIERKLWVIIETDGYFIDQNNYSDILLKLVHKNIFIRISFDERHRPTQVDFHKMASFAKVAIEKNIQFGFYSLGMNKDQISQFIIGTDLDEYENYFLPLTLHERIQDVKLFGVYLNVDGDHLAQIK
jgi:organic radical activating enzyme